MPSAMPSTAPPRTSVGEVHIEVQPGKGDKGCQHQRGRAQLSVLQPERVGSRHPGGGVPGGEGMPMRTRHQHGDGGVDIAGAGTGEQRLEEEVPCRHVQHQRHRHGKARFAGAPEEQKQQGERDPDLAVSTGVIKKRWRSCSLPGCGTGIASPEKQTQRAWIPPFGWLESRFSIQYSI